jgi:small-conductance mechanosensitive channel
MSDSGEDVSTLLAELVRTLQDLQREVEPRTEQGRPRPPTPKELIRFTSDVTIPAAILVLKTNIEALKLLRRALRLAEGRPPTETRSGGVQERATQLSRATLARLDDALSDLQGAVEGQPPDAEARELLTEARQLRESLTEQLAESQATNSDDDAEVTEVPVDVDAELQSIKDDIEDVSDGHGEGNNDDKPS